MSKNCGLWILLLCPGGLLGIETSFASEPVNVLHQARWTYSTDGGKTYSSDVPVLPSSRACRIKARTTFQVKDPAGYAGLELSRGHSRNMKSDFSLNGRRIQGPIKGMFYRTIPAIGPSLLKRGKNVLTVEIHISKAARNRMKPKTVLSFKPSLLALKAEHLKIQTGPVLGAAGSDWFTVTVRTNLPARTTLTVKSPAGRIQKQSRSRAGLIHRFLMRGLGPGKTYTYRIEARLGSSTATTPLCSVRTLDPDKPLRFVAMADSRTHPKDWSRVAEAVVKVKPDLIVFAGDMVTNGRDDWQWDHQFVHPAKSLLGEVPFYAVIGNHENNAPVFFELFQTPGGDRRGRNWSQKIGHVLLIGIDGGGNWSPKGKNFHWLRQILSETKANYIFLFTHYPAWTSGPHGRLNKESQPREKAVRQSQQFILPLLARYKATAMIAGHDHCYERSEPPGGVSMIVSGGAGAPLYGKVKRSEKQNPHSRVFINKHHYCLFSVTADRCEMIATTPEGEILDRRIWKPR